MSSSTRRRHPHDLVFRFVFSRVQHARAPLREIVGEEYIWSAGSDEGMIEAIIEHSRDDVKDSAMSVADRLWARGWEKGWQEGQAAGREEGRDEGRAMLLLRQLEHRFGALPQHVEARVLAALPQQIETWALRLLSSASLVEALSED